MILTKGSVSRSLKVHLSTVEDAPATTKLTQKEYYIAIRNRLFAVEEQIWLHEYATQFPKSGKIQPLSESKYNKLLIARGDLLEEYPLTRLQTDLFEAQARNLTFASIFIERLVTNLNRQLPIPLEHLNLLAVVSFGGQVVNLVRGQGYLHHRLLPTNSIANKGVKRQYQHPTFSASGKHVGMVEMYFRDGLIERANALVYEVPSTPKAFSKGDSLPLFDSGSLVGTPFFIRFSPDGQTIAMLCTNEGDRPGERPYNSLVLLEWEKFYRRDLYAGRASSARISGRTALTLLRGNPLYFSYTTSAGKNATIVAHSNYKATKQGPAEKAVWMLQRQDTGGVRDFQWTKVADADASVKWTVPACHSAGGGDNVLVVEDGYLVSKALSRWKRREDGSMPSKRLLKVQGSVQFLVAPDHSRAVVLQQDIASGVYSLTAIEGEGALDPCSPSMGRQFEMPTDQLVVAFWWSPDSTKVLFLSAAERSKRDIVTQKGDFKVAANSPMQWSVFNFPYEEMRTFDSFKPTVYFMKTNIPFFDQYSQVFNPWAPDSRSFVYVTAEGMTHVPLDPSKHCLGQDKWQNRGATFGTWSRF